MKNESSEPFAIAADGVDPNAAPKRVLHTGAEIPAVGLGTFGSDRFSGKDVAGAVKGAATVGYRHFDCASVYGNEEQIGHSFREIIAGGPYLYMRLKQTNPERRKDCFELIMVNQ